MFNLAASTGGLGAWASGGGAATVGRRCQLTMSASPKGLIPVIVRICEATPRHGMLEKLRDFLMQGVREFPERYEGFLGDEILVGDDSVLYVSRWRDESALKNYAGTHWRDCPVVLPEEEQLLDEPMRVRHFSAVSPER